MKFLKLTLFLCLVTGCVTTKEPISQTHSRKMELALKQVQKCDFNKAKKIIGSIPETTLRFKYPSSLEWCRSSEFNSYPQKSIFRLLSLTEKAVSKASSECGAIPNKESDDGFKNYEKCMNEKIETLDIPYEEFTKGNQSEYEQDKTSQLKEVKPENLPFCRPSDYVATCLAKEYALVQDEHNKTQASAYKEKVSEKHTDIAKQTICGFNFQISVLAETRDDSAALLEKQMKASGAKLDKNKLEASLLMNKQNVNNQIAGIKRERQVHVKAYEKHSGKSWSDSNCE